METIKQIVPAEGWWAVFTQKEKPGYRRVRVVCWAILVESHQPSSADEVTEYEPEVVGLYSNDTAVLQLVVGTPEFIGYVHEAAQ